jgi:hypothetical protein
MLWCMQGGTDKEIFDVVVGSAETEERVGRLKGMVGRLRKLTHCYEENCEEGKLERLWRRW